MKAKKLYKLFNEWTIAREAQQELRTAYERAAYEQAAAERAGSAEPSTDHEADFQGFLRAYDLPARLIRVLRVAYMVGVADAQTPEL